jgi:nitroreductase
VLLTNARNPFILCGLPEKETPMEYMDVIRKRRSIRKFRDIPVPKQAIDDIVESARLAPSGGNAQNWLFGVITDKVLIKELSEVAGPQTWISETPLIVAVCADIRWKIKEQSEDDYGMRINEIRFTPELIRYLGDYHDQESVAVLLENGTVMIPGEHICLTAANHGLGSCWIGDLNVKKASKILGLPDNYACAFLILVGYPDMEPVDIERKNISEITFHNTYGSNYY